MTARSLFAALVLAAAAIGRLAADEPITLMYEDRPPYKVRNPDGTLSGPGLAPVEAAFRAAHVAYVWEEVPALREVELIRANHDKTCGTAFYKTPERSGFAKFSKPLFRDTPLVVVVAKFAAFDAKRSFEALLGDPKATVILRAGTAYGDTVDAWIARAKAETVYAAVSEDNIMDMIAIGRGDFTIMRREVVDLYAKREHTRLADLEVLTPPDTPPGGSRYLMCSAKVDDAILQAINQYLPDLPAN